MGCSEKQTTRIGFLLHQSEGRWVNDIKYLEYFAKENGVELLVKNAGGNEALQLAQSDELIQQGVDVIVIVAVNQNTAPGIVRKAHKAGIKVIAYDRIIRNSELDYLISYDYYLIGKMMAEYSTEIAPMGNYIQLWGDASDANALAMRSAQENHLKSYEQNGLNVVYRSFIDGWSGKNAEQILKQISDFSDQEIDVVLASNDVIAQSAVQFFESKSPKRKMLVTGQDATLEACRSIARKKQTMTIYKPTREMAREAINLAIKISLNNKIEYDFDVMNNGRIDVPTLFLEPILVTSANLRETVVADGLFTEEEVYGDAYSHLN
jgi:D-xylose transport system substrate-binding protein